jgi:hypothetical protein
MALKEFDISSVRLKDKVPTPPLLTGLLDPLPPPPQANKMNAINIKKMMPHDFIGFINDSLLGSIISIYSNIKDIGYNAK